MKAIVEATRSSEFFKAFFNVDVLLVRLAMKQFRQVGMWL